MMRNKPGTASQNSKMVWDFPGGAVVKNLPSRGFAGGLVVKNPPANAGDTSSIPDPGRAYMPQSS